MPDKFNNAAQNLTDTDPLVSSRGERVKEADRVAINAALNAAGTITAEDLAQRIRKDAVAEKRTAAFTEINRVFPDLPVADLNTALDTIAAPTSTTIVPAAGTTYQEHLVQAAARHHISTGLIATWLTGATVSAWAKNRRKTEETKSIDHILKACEALVSAVIEFRFPFKKLLEKQPYKAEQVTAAVKSIAADTRVPEANKWNVLRRWAVHVQPHDPGADKADIVKAVEAFNHPTATTVTYARGFVDANMGTLSACQFTPHFHHGHDFARFQRDFGTAFTTFQTALNGQRDDGGELVKLYAEAKGGLLDPRIKAYADTYRRKRDTLKELESMRSDQTKLAQEYACYQVQEHHGLANHETQELMEGMVGYRMAVEAATGFRARITGISRIGYFVRGWTLDLPFKFRNRTWRNPYLYLEHEREHLTHLKTRERNILKFQGAGPEVRRARLEEKSRGSMTDWRRRRLDNQLQQARLEVAAIDAQIKAIEGIIAAVEGRISGHATLPPNYLASQPMERREAYHTLAAEYTNDQARIDGATIVRAANGTVTHHPVFHHIRPPNAAEISRTERLWRNIHSSGGPVTMPDALLTFAHMIRYGILPGVNLNNPDQARELLCYARAVMKAHP